tara:strand:- start:50 stop:295 length:246 start_codon:yes stop_codon:yes gene_type:complete
MSELSVEQQNEESKLNIKDFEVIFDVLNVFDPNDISHVYPEMGTNQFMKDVNSTWKKVLDIIKNADDPNTISKGYTIDKKE